MTVHLKALIKWAAKLHKDGLEACHYTEEFTLQWGPLGTERNWSSSARGLLIQTAIRQLVKS
jgi:hypothetical protein